MILRINPGSTHEAPLPGKPHYPWLGFPFSLLLLLTFLFPVNAQNTTTLSASPVISQVMLNSQVSLDLMLTDAVNVNAFDVIVEYDDALLRLDGWANGGFLSNLAVVVKTDNPGYFRLFCTQLATPPVSGNGSLIRLTFSGLALGNSDIAITKGELADSQGQKTDPTLEGGRVSVVATTVPSLTPTATLTQPPPNSSPTYTPTPSATLPPSPTTPNPYPVGSATFAPTALPTQPRPATSSTSAPSPTAQVQVYPGQTQAPGATLLPTPLLASPIPDQTGTPGLGSSQPDYTTEAIPSIMLPLGTIPLRNTDPASIWKPGQKAALTLPWVILGVEVILLAVLAWLLFRRKR